MSSIIIVVWVCYHVACPKYIIVVHNTFFHTILIADVLQTLHADVGNPYAMWHEYSTDKHFVIPTFGVHKAYSTITFRIPLRHSNLFAYLIFG